MSVRQILRLLAFIGLFSSISINSYARNCGSIQNTRELYECILENHPDFKKATLTKEAAAASRDKMTQLPNPEISLTSVSGSNGGEKVGSTELSLSISVTDLLLKRSALSKAGRFEEAAMNVEARNQEFLAKASVLKSLYRYRQLLNEIDLVNEAIEAFGKIENQLKSRRARGPDQDITLNLVELALGDYELRKNHLAVEKLEIEAQFKGIFGPSFELKADLLPKLRQSWPDVSIDQVSRNTFELQKLEAERNKSEAERSLASADAWPKISAGPVIERATDGPNQFNSYGFNLSMDIPIFSLNGGARQLANKNLMIAELQYDYASKKAELERQLLLQKYKSAVDSLKKSINAESLKRKHAQVDSYFRQGLTSGSTVIEAHRQFAEFTESQHEHEMVALESLMYLNLLSQKDPSEVLK